MDYICTSCNYKGVRKKTISGSNIVSVLLWIVLPTLYMAWQLRSFTGTMDPTVLLQNATNFGVADIAVNAPGPIYSIWRRVKKSYSCPQCAEKVMLPSRRNQVLGGMVVSAKEHEVEIERKLVEMEIKLQERKKDKIVAPLADIKEDHDSSTSKTEAKNNINKKEIRHRVDKDEW